MQNPNLNLFKDIKIVKLQNENKDINVAKLQSPNFNLFKDIKVARIAKLENPNFNIFKDIKVARVAKLQNPNFNLFNPSLYGLGGANLPPSAVFLLQFKNG